MSLLEYDEESFYTYAMKLLSSAGHVATSEPKFSNHSPEQFIYFDNKDEIYLSSNQRAMFKMFSCVSHLFSVHDCAFFSMNLLTTRGNRSQVAYDLHTMIHPIVEANATICLFRFNDEIMLSFVGYGSHCILSDWYFLDDNNEQLIDKLDIANISIRNGYEYFSDMVYALSRPYYLTSVPTVYELLPIDFISIESFDGVDREVLNQFIEYELAAPQREYCDDYVGYDESFKPQPLEINADLDLMLLEMDDEDDNPFGEEIENDDEVPEHDEFEQQDEYEFDDVNPEIFRDPTLMVKWLNQVENNSQHETPITPKSTSL